MMMMDAEQDEFQRELLANRLWGIHKLDKNKIIQFDTVKPYEKSRERKDTKEPRKHRSKIKKKKVKKKAHKFWDIPPLGYENITTSQYKALQKAGQVAPHLIVPKVPIAPAPAPVQHTPSFMDKQSKRLYLGNIPPGITEDEIGNFFNNQMRKSGLIKGGGQPIVSVLINNDKNFAFLELRTAEETTKAIALDGFTFHGCPMKIRRPRDYQPLPGQQFRPDIIIPGALPTVVADTVNKLFVTGLPVYLNDEQVKELLVSFGPLKSFNLAKDVQTGFSKGYAFCEYADPTITDQACVGLTGMPLGDKKLVVQRAGIGKDGQVPIQVPGLSLKEGIGPPTEVLCLMNMITEDDLNDDEEFKDIFEDVREELSKYGTINSIEIPRPCEGNNVSGVGKIFVEFNSIFDSRNAQKGLSGRKFSNRVVVTSFYDLEKYRRREY